MKILKTIISHYVHTFICLVIVAFPINLLGWIFSDGGLFPMHVLAITAIFLTAIYTVSGWIGLTLFAEMYPDHPEVQDIKSRGGSVYWDSSPYRPRDNPPETPEEWRPIK